MQVTNSPESPFAGQSIELEGNELALLTPSALGFPTQAKIGIRKVFISTQSAVIWIKLEKQCNDLDPSDFYPAFRELALTIDEDCKQMGLVVPVVITLQLPLETDAFKWSQLDTDTDLNSGEFAVRLPTGATDFRVIAADDKQMEAFIATIQSQQFALGSLTDPIRPRNEDDYRDALLRADFSYRSPMHKELIAEYIQPNWKNPANLAKQLNDFVKSLGEATPTNQSST